MKKIRDTRGFTLLEFAIVMSIMGILAVISFPSFTSGLQELRINQAAEKIAADIRYIRELAIHHHDTYGITINTGTETYSLFQWDGVNQIVLSSPHTGGAMTVDISSLTEFSGTTITSAGVSEVRISAFGVPLDNLDVALTAPVDIVIANGGLTRTIRVTHETAMVQVL